MAAKKRHAVCKTTDVAEGKCLIVQVGRRDIGIYNIKGEFLAVLNFCPHAGAPICEGVLSGAIMSDGLFNRHLEHEGCILKCPWHAWEFKLPEGTTLTEPKRRLLMYPVHIEAGQVFIELRAEARGEGSDLTEARA